MDAFPIERGHGDGKLDGVAPWAAGASFLAERLGMRSPNEQQHADRVVGLTRDGRRLEERQPRREG
jgi:hypothetical protein